MKWKDAQLCYCQTIHPTDSWAECLHALATHAVAVKKEVCPDNSFGVGLRLSAAAARELRGGIAAFKTFLEERGLYVFTITGFPYGEFHGPSVKQQAYQPDWSHNERLDYTRALADILAELLPEGGMGSVSTLPLCYGKQATDRMFANLATAAAHLEHVHARTGRQILLGLEPEPDCYLEKTGEAIDCMRRLASLSPAAARYIGVCLDTCHAAVEQESPIQALRQLEQANVRVAKIQISSVLRYRHAAWGAANSLAPFADPVYLHQTRVLTDSGMRRYGDLPEALAENPAGDWLVHFHVPLYYPETDGISSTSYLLDRAFLDYAGRRGYHLEIETYSYSRLPGSKPDVVDSIVREYGFVMRNISREGT